MPEISSSYNNDYDVSVYQSAPSFRSTSMHMQRESMEKGNDFRAYSTSKVCTTNSRITTVASSIRGGMLTEQGEGTSNLRGRQNTMAPPDNTDPFVPLDFGWDVVLLLAFLSIGYAIYIRRRKCLELTKQ